MKRIILAAALGMGVLTISMAGSTVHSTAPHSVLKYDTVPSDTTTPTTKPDSTKLN